MKAKQIGTEECDLHACCKKKDIWKGNLPQPSNHFWQQVGDKDTKNRMNIVKLLDETKENYRRLNWQVDKNTKGTSQIMWHMPRVRNEKIQHPAKWKDNSHMADMKKKTLSQLMKHSEEPMIQYNHLWEPDHWIVGGFWEKKSRKHHLPTAQQALNSLAW